MSIRELPPARAGEGDGEHWAWHEGNGWSQLGFGWSCWPGGPCSGLAFPPCRDAGREEVCPWGGALGHLRCWGGPAAFQRHARVWKPHLKSAWGQKTWCALALLSLAGWIWGPFLEGDASGFGYFSSLGVMATPVGELPPWRCCSSEGLLCYQPCSCPMPAPGRGRNLALSVSSALPSSSAPVSF